MPDDEKQWFHRAADGSEKGPESAAEMRALAASGEIAADTPVRRGSSAWRPAASVPECGFDCIVLRFSPAPEALGPFPRECLARPEVAAALAGDSVAFFRAGSAAEEARRVSAAAAAPEVVEAEIVEEPPRGGPARGGAMASGMAALESQLRKELRMAGAVRGAAPLAGLFKTR